ALGVHGVGLGALPALAGRAAAADLGQGTRRPGTARTEPFGAPPQREGLVQGRPGVLRGPGAAERAEIGCAVVADLADDRQARERLVGELEPHGPIRRARP